MVDLASCYFCGAVESLKEYPVIPQDFYPPDEVQRTVVVCPTCREKLASVLEPVLGYLEAPETADHPTSASSSSTPANVSTPADERSTDSPSATVTTKDRPASTTNRSRNAGEDTPQETSSPATATAGNGANESSLMDKIEHDRERVYTESRDAGYRWDPDDTGSSNGLPDTAKQVARLLQNRDFPVERATIEDLASGAYDIHRSDCREAIDALVREGYLTESDGVLREA